jgi:hypothetical protein
MQDATAATVLGELCRTPASTTRASNRPSSSAATSSWCAPTARTASSATTRSAYTFGVYPLQQYLIAFPRRALPGAADRLGCAAEGARADSAGSTCNPGQKIDHTDPLHWTGIYQNWALQCAECHSTNLRKGYDAASDTYRTTYSEINVACEACHGPGSRMSTGPQGQGAVCRRRATRACRR